MSKFWGSLQGAQPTSQRGKKIALWIVTVLVLGLVTFPYYGGYVLTPASTSPSVFPDDQKEFKQEELHVGGMSCAGCARVVKSALESVPGVVSVEVSLANQKATVTVEQGKQDRPGGRPGQNRPGGRPGAEVKQLIDAVNATGYRAWPGESNH